MNNMQERVAESNVPEIHSAMTGYLAQMRFENHLKRSLLFEKKPLVRLSHS